MAVHTEAPLPFECVQWLVNQDYCVEEVTLTAAQAALPANMVMAIVTGTGNWVPYDDDANGATPGQGIAAGILMYPAPVNAATQKIVVLRRGPAIVKKDSLQWEASNDATEKNAAVAELLALGIQMRGAAFA
jgi:hypothetical protein